MRTVICMPTYNERENLPSLLEEIFATVDDVDVMVLDDNSPDGTGAAADGLAKKHKRLQVVHRPGKAGIAAAYADGFARAIEQGYDRIFQMDADYSHQPRYLPKLIEALDRADMVIGSRYVEGGRVEQWSAPRRLLSRAGNAYANTLLGLPYRDATAGFCGYRRHVLEAIELGASTKDNHAFQVELKYRVHDKGFTIVEVPIMFWDRVVGASKLPPRAALGSAMRILRLRIKGTD